MVPFLARFFHKNLVMSSVGLPLNCPFMKVIPVGVFFCPSTEEVVFNLPFRPRL